MYQIWVSRLVPASVREECYVITCLSGISFFMTFVDQGGEIQKWVFLTSPSFGQRGVLCHHMFVWNTQTLYSGQCTPYLLFDALSHGIIGNID